LNPSGSQIEYCTYLGGSGDEGDVRAIAVDAQGAAYVGGQTRSRDFPLKNPFQTSLSGPADAFLAKLSPGGDALLFSSYLGGTGYDTINAIAIGGNNDLYLGGNTSSSDFPTVAALQRRYGGSGADAFIARLNPTSRKLVFSTYIGGSDIDNVLGLALDSSDNAYVVGFTRSPDFPVADALQSTFGNPTWGEDGFLAVLSYDGSSLLYSSFLGGSAGGDLDGVALDSAGNVYTAGGSTSFDLPVGTPILPLASPFGSAVVVKFTNIGTLPPLKVIRSGTALVITWPANISGAFLEQIDSLPAEGWMPISTPPVVVGDENVVTLDIGSARQFLRLGRQ
jgi:hypothetical protein